MKLFIDTANIEEIKEINSWGIVSGVTTNPTLIARSKRKVSEVIKEICELVDGPVSGEVISRESKGMILEARSLVKIHHNVVVKIPITEEGLKAVKTLKEENIKTNVTLVFSAQQALLAARAGASYVSPFVGRLEDIGYDGLHLIEDIRNIFETHNINTEIIAASIRNPRHVIESAKKGAHIGTMPYNIFKEMLNHPLTDSGLDKFIKDWEDSQSN